MKHAAAISYALLTILSGYWMVSSFIGNRGTDLSWRPDDIAFTFVFMTLFVLSAFILQLNRPMSWWLVVQTGLVGVPLLVAAFYHMYPERAIIAASLHLFLAALFTVLNVITQVRSPH